MFAFSAVLAATLANSGRPEGGADNPYFLHRAPSDVMQRDMEHAAMMWGDQIAVIECIGARHCKRRAGGMIANHNVLSLQVPSATATNEHSEDATKSR